jgi:hypothetical protein
MTGPDCRRKAWGNAQATPRPGTPSGKGVGAFSASVFGSFVGRCRQSGNREAMAAIRRLFRPVGHCRRCASFETLTDWLGLTKISQT